jgi:hypothetical protein
MCKALTGLSVVEFKNLTADFSWNYHEYEVKRRPDRIRKLGGGRDAQLKTLEDKLFYILFYLKVYPTFDLAAFQVGFARSKACEWVHLLLPILETTMKRKFVLPLRKISSPEEFSLLYPEARSIFVDGMERSIQRFKNKKRQQKTYSGKKKQHTKKSIVVSDGLRRVLVLTKARSGRRHDKKLADKDMIFESIPKDTEVFADTGFVGAQRVHSKIHIPKKSSRNNPLTPSDREFNRIISSIRVVVEHAIGGIKRYRCMSDKYRNKKAFIDDHFQLLSAGLWNYHLNCIK